MSGFVRKNDEAMLDEIQTKLKSYNLTTQDFVVIDGDPVKTGFQLFTRWIIKETGCQLIWAKKLPLGFDKMEANDKEKARDKLRVGVEAWAKELPNTTIYMLEISGERQDEEMCKVFGSSLVPEGDRPKWNSRHDFFKLGGEMQKGMEDMTKIQDETVKAYAQQIKEFAEAQQREKDGLEYCAFENAAKGMVIRSLLRPHADKSLTLLTGGGQATVLEIAASLMTNGVNPKTELLAIPARRGKDSDPNIPKVVPQLG